jgi:hypothetical protein
LSQAASFTLSPQKQWNDDDSGWFPDGEVVKKGEEAQIRSENERMSQMAKKKLRLSILSNQCIYLSVIRSLAFCKRQINI